MNAESPAPCAVPVLVIGWGSELRGDDAVGRVFARRLDALSPAGVEVIEVPQLTPELAWDVSGAERVVFVDAVTPGAVEGVGDEPVLRKLAPGDAAPARFIPACVHSLSPERVLDLSSALYSDRPEAWVLYLPAFDFDLGLEMSAGAKAGVDEGLRLLLDLVQVTDVTRFSPQPLHPIPQLL